MKCVRSQALVLAAAALLGGTVGFLRPDRAAERNDRAGEAGADRSGKSHRDPNAGGRGRRPFIGADTMVDEEFVAWLREASDGELRSVVMEEFGSRYAALNFRSATILRELFRRDPEGTMAFLEREAPKRANLMLGAFRTWASVDPSGATAGLREYMKRAGEEDRVSTWMTLDCLRALAVVDREAAFEAATRFSRRSQHRDYAFKGVLAACAATDPGEMAGLMSRVKEAGAIRPRDWRRGRR